MTLKKARQILRDHGMVIRKTGYNEYRVGFKGGSEAYAAYESNIEDALDTAQIMYMNKHRGNGHK